MSERVTPIWEDLVNRLQYVEDIVEQLQLTGTLTQNEAEDIEHKKTPRQIKAGLLDAIIRKCAYDIFSQCLRVSDQEELYQLIVSTGPVQPVTDELTTLAYRVYCKHGIGDPRKLNVPPHLQQRLNDQCDVLQEMKSVGRLLNLMEDERCLTTEMVNVIQEQPNDKDKVRMLIDHTVKSTLYSVFVLVKFLDISQQKHLLQQINEEDTKKGVDYMKGLLLEVYYSLLGGIALKDSELEERLGVKARDFVTLSINDDFVAVERLGSEEAHCERASGKVIELVDLFRDQHNEQETRTVLLIGAPGAGKTTAVMQLAREATAKKATNVPRPPFLIQLRSIDWTTETSLKNLLLCCGPTLTASESEQVWSALSEHDTDVTVILDGADEAPPGFLDLNASPVSGTEQKASPKHILNNLILGKLLKRARVLVSSRPFGLEQCWSKFRRKCEVAGFSEKSLERFLTNELATNHLPVVLQFLKNRTDVRHLLLIPLHAVTFVLRAQSITEEDDLLLQSRTELSMSLIDSLVKTKCWKEAKGAINCDVNTINAMALKAKGSTLLKICKCVAGMLLSRQAIKIEMSEEDLDKAGISGDECVATGLFSEKIIVTGEMYKRIYLVPHQSILECMAALGLEESQIMQLITLNGGRHDLVLTYVVGVFGSQNNRNILEYILNKEDQKEELTKLTRNVVRAVLRSRRRLLKGGEDFCIQLVNESQQWDLIAELMRVMKTRWLRPDSSEALMAAGQLIRHGPCVANNDPFVRVQVEGIKNMKFCSQATVLRHYGELATADIATNSEHLRDTSSITFDTSGFTRQTLPDVIEELRRLPNLEALSMEGNKMGSASSEDESSVLGCFSSLSSLRYLRLSSCDLRSHDVTAVTSSAQRLRHLDISWNRCVQGDGVRSETLTGISLALCELDGEEVVKMAARNGQSLQFINAARNSISSYDVTSILTACPLLEELYVSQGGELVRALSERRGALRLNHLWLSVCDLSSSSSSCKQVSSLMLRDVLTNHSSITSLTLYKCYPFRAWHPFTPRVMRHLSSSMASITSLFISPHHHHLPPRPSDVASLIRASHRLTQIWLDDVRDAWRASDYSLVICAINASSLSTVGLDVEGLSVDEICDVIRQLKRSLTRIWLAVGKRKKREEEYAEVVEEKEAGVIQIVPGGDDLYSIYMHESGSFYQHLPLSLHGDFCP